MSRGITQKAVDSCSFQIWQTLGVVQNDSIFGIPPTGKVLDLYYVTATKFGMATQLGGTRFYGPTTP